MQMQDVFQRYAEDLQRVEARMDLHLRSEIDLIPETVSYTHLTLPTIYSV